MPGPGVCLRTDDALPAAKGAAWAPRAGLTGTGRHTPHTHPWAWGGPACLLAIRSWSGESGWGHRHRAPGLRGQLKSRCLGHSEGGDGAVCLAGCWPAVRDTSRPATAVTYCPARRAHSGPCGEQRPGKEPRLGPLSLTGSTGRRSAGMSLTGTPTTTILPPAKTTPPTRRHGTG